MSDTCLEQLCKLLYLSISDQPSQTLREAKMRDDLMVTSVILDVTPPIFTLHMVQRGTEQNPVYQRFKIALQKKKDTNCG